MSKLMFSLNFLLLCTLYMNIYTCFMKFEGLVGEPYYTNTNPGLLLYWVLTSKAQVLNVITSHIIEWNHNQSANFGNRCSSQATPLMATKAVSPGLKNGSTLSRP